MVASDARSAVGQIARRFYYFFMAVVVRYEAEAAARGALTFIVRIFVNDAVAIAVWTSFNFHGSTRVGRSGPEPSAFGTPGSNAKSAAVSILRLRLV
jgi:hypothetical protein